MPDQRSRLDGRIALITGASRGIGRAIALSLAAAGADVLLLSRSRAELEEVAVDVRHAGRSAHLLVCDLTDLAGLRRALDGAPTPSILINNAATNQPEPFLDVTESTFDRILDVNLRSLFFCAQEVARRMIAAGTGGVIVNLSSQMGHVGGRDRSVYCATKHAVEGLTKAIALELAPHGIRVNAVAPTYVRTAMTERFLSDPARRADMLERIPLGRLGEAHEVADAIAFLASDAASLITGGSLRTDGGYTAQ